ncbi:MAG TPA: prepilin-type N-terminal cleavage/methylation domain-containing protein [Pirellulales bacterium]|nr:prepilin-type N-terminal cleavage/methylation domain-containing protein [Pirellulales bacterium]
MYDRRSNRENRRAGFTLVEVMIATALTLLLMALVAQLFAMVGNAAADTREMIQVTDRLRACKQTLQSDLGNLTAPMLPPLKPEQAHGYFEYVEGPAGPIVPGSAEAKNIDQLDTTGVPLPDTTVGDPDDVLMFTTRNEESPFYGRYRQIYSYIDPVTGPPPVQKVVDGTTMSNYAEIVWFLRGNTLYRRVLLVKPTGLLQGNWIETAQLLSTNWSPFNYDISFYEKFDVSVHQEGGTYDTRAGFTGQPPFLAANSLRDLTLRQNRYGHQPWSYPYDTRFWSPVTNPYPGLGMPTLRECTFYTNMISTLNPAVARWPFPFYDATYTPNLWGVATSFPPPTLSPIPYPPSPVIFPYPNVSPTNYQPVNTQSTAYPPALNLTIAPGQYYDAWVNPYPWQQVSPSNGAIYAFSGAYQPSAGTNSNANQSYDGSTRVSEDVILTNVISFDVKAWDPTAPIVSNNTVTGNPLNPLPLGSAVYTPGDLGYTQLMQTWATSASGDALTFQQTVQAHTVGIGAYVDLNYMSGVSKSFASTSTMYAAITQLSVFAGPGLAIATSGLGAVYDTGSFTYENDGLDQNGDGVVDNFTNGFDDNGIGGVDDLTEIEGPTPYPVPLKGIQVKIRVFEPDSRQIREVTVTEDFLWE